MDSKRINSLSEGAELFYRKLMSIVDDFGRYEADSDVLAAKVYALRRSRTATDIAVFLEECTGGDNPLIIIYQVGRKTYLEIQDFGQRLRSKESKFPGPDGGQVRPSAAKCGQVRPSAAHARGCALPTPTPSAHASVRPMLEMRRPPQVQCAPADIALAIAVNSPPPAFPPRNGPSLTDTPDAINPDCEIWCETRYMRHRKKKHKFAAMSLLCRLYLNPVKRELFARHHDLWCETAEWRKENGRFCPPLDEWIDNDGYVDPPDAPVTDSADYEYEVPEI